MSNDTMNVENKVDFDELDVKEIFKREARESLNNALDERVGPVKITYTDLFKGLLGALIFSVGYPVVVLCLLIVLPIRVVKNIVSILFHEIPRYILDITDGGLIAGTLLAPALIFHAVFDMVAFVLIFALLLVVWFMQRILKVGSELFWDLYLDLELI